MKINDKVQVEFYGAKGSIWGILQEAVVYRQSDAEYLKLLQPTSGKQGYMFSKDANYVPQYLHLNGNNIPLMYKDDLQKALWWTFFQAHKELLSAPPEDIDDPLVRSVILHGLDSISPSRVFLNFVEGVTKYYIISEVLKAEAVDVNGLVYTNAADLDAADPKSFAVLHHVKTVDDEQFLALAVDSELTEDLKFHVETLAECYNLPVGIYLGSSGVGFVRYDVQG